MRRNGTRKLNRTCTLLLCLGIWQILPAQIPAADNPDARADAAHSSPGAIRISTNLVTVPVSVTDAVGSPVANLDKEDFQIKEDGRKENILTMIQAGQSPLQLTLLLDLSESVQSDFESERMAANHFLKKVWNPGDSVSIIAVGKQPQIHLEASASLEDALRIISRLQPVESATAFFDAVAMAAGLLNRSTAPDTRQASVIFSDGEDNSSECSFAEALEALQHSNSVMYSINPGGASVRLNEISRQGQKWLASLAGETGGASFVLSRDLDLNATYHRIAVELRAQYLLSYYSSNPQTDGSFRRIMVSIPEMPELQVRARPGYYAVLAFRDPRE
ncbi:MAG: VWA domain-containing protein [Acidobacteria bacterium]|nr:VWA domain-containing protein [Acidobacteriota bacterium]